MIPKTVVGAPGHWRDFGTPENFLHMQHLDAVGFFAECKRQPLRFWIVSIHYSRAVLSKITSRSSRFIASSS